jgi:hypothetical protein
MARTNNSIIFRLIKPLGSDSNHESESVKSSDGRPLYSLYKIIFLSSLIRIQSLPRKKISYCACNSNIHCESEKEKGKIARRFFKALFGLGASPQLLKGAVRGAPIRRIRPGFETLRLSVFLISEKAICVRF